MKFYIIETKKTEELTLIDPKSGVDYISDYIGNTGAFLSGREFAKYDEEKVLLFVIKPIMIGGRRL